MSDVIDTTNISAPDFISRISENPAALTPADIKFTPEQQASLSQVFDAMQVKAPEFQPAPAPAPDERYYLERIKTTVGHPDFQVNAPRSIAATIAAAQLEKDPSKYASELELMSHIEKEFGFSPKKSEEARQMFLTKQYADKFQSGEIPISVLYHPLSKALNKEDYNKLSDMFVLMNKDWLEYSERSTVSKMWIDGDMRQQIINDARTGKKSVAEALYSLRIMDKLNEDNGLIASYVGGIGQSINNIISFEWNPDSVSQTEQEINDLSAKRFHAFDTLRRENIYLASVLDTTHNTRGSFDGTGKFVARLLEQDIDIEFGTNALEIAYENGLNLAQVEQAQMNARNLYGAILGASMFANFLGGYAGGAATTGLKQAAKRYVRDLLGGVVIGQSQEAVLEALKTEGANQATGKDASLMQAAARGFTQNFIESLGTATIFSAPALVDLGRQGLTAHRDYMQLKHKTMAADKASELSTSDTASESTVDLVDKSLAPDVSDEKGFQQRNGIDNRVYINISDLVDLINSQEGGLNIFGDKVREFIGDLNERINRGDTEIEITVGQLGQYFKKDPNYSLIDPLLRNTPDGRTRAELERYRSQGIDEMRYLSENMGDVVNSNKEERARVAAAAQHSMAEEIMNAFHRSVADMAIPNLKPRAVTEMAKEVSNFMLSVGEVLNLDDAQLKKLYEKHLPKFEFVDEALDVTRGTTAPKELGEFVPTDKGNIIKLHRNADLTTLMHETSHMFLHVMLNAADEFPDNEKLKDLKRELFTSFKVDPALKWSEVPFEQQTKIQEVFAYDYLVDRMSSAYIYDKEHRSDRTLKNQAVLSRALGQALIKHNGFPVRGTKGKRRELLDEAMKKNKEQFELNYGFGSDTGAARVMAMAVNEMTNRAFTYHRISQLFPWTKDSFPLSQLKDSLPPDLYSVMESMYKNASARLELVATDGVLEQGRQMLHNLVDLNAELENAIRNDPDLKMRRANISELERINRASLREQASNNARIEETTDKITKETNRLDKYIKTHEKELKRKYAVHRITRANERIAEAKEKLAEYQENAKRIEEDLKANAELMAEEKKALAEETAKIEKRIGDLKQNTKQNSEEAAKIRAQAERAFKNKSGKEYRTWEKLQTYYNEAVQKPFPASALATYHISPKTIEHLRERNLITDAAGADTNIETWQALANTQGTDIRGMLTIMASHAVTEEDAIANYEAKLAYRKFHKTDQFVDHVVDISITQGRQLISSELQAVYSVLNPNGKGDRPKIAEDAAKRLRVATGNLLYSNTSPDQLIRRANEMRRKAFSKLVEKGKDGKGLDTNDVPRLMEAYNDLMMAYVYNELAITATRLKRDLNADIERIRRTLRSRNVSANYDMDTLEAVHVIMGRLGLSKRRDTVKNLDTIRTMNPDAYDQVAEIINKPGMQTGLQSMTLGDLVSAVDLMQTVIHRAKEIRKVIKDKETKWLAESGTKAQAVLQEAIERDPKKLQEQQARAEERDLSSNDRTLNREDIVKKKYQTIRNSTVSVASMFERLDGQRFGPLKDLFYQGIADAEGKYLDLSNKFGKRLNPVAEFMNKLDKDNLFSDSKVVFATTNPDAKTKAWVIKPRKDASIQKQLMAILVNTGTESNLEAMARSMNTTPDAIASKLKELTDSGVITKEMWDNAQIIWDAYRDIGELTIKAHKELTGEIYDRVPPRQIKTVHGTYTGGYVPIHSIRPEQIKTLDEAMQDYADGVPPSARAGFTKQRTTSNNQIDLTVPAIFDSMEKQLRYATILPEVMKAHNLAKSSSKMVAALDDAMPGFFDDIYTPWLVAVANQTSSNARDLQGLSLMNNLAGMLNASVLSFNVVNAMQQYTGLIVAGLRVAPAALAAAVVKRKRVSEVAAASVFMKNRFAVEDVSIGKLRRNIMTTSTFGKSRNFLMDHAYFLQSVIQRHVDTIIWTAKYNEVSNRLRKQGEKDPSVIDKRAIREADDAVRSTQGSFNTSDSTAIDRSPVIKSLLPFTSYFTTLQNVVMAEIGIRNAHAQSKFRKVWNAGVVAMLAMILPSVAGTLMVQGLKGEYYGDEETSDLLLEAGVKSPLMTTLAAANPVLGVVGGNIWDTFLGDTTNNSLLNTPVATFLPQLMLSIRHFYQCIADDRDLTANDWGNVARVFSMYMPQFANITKQIGVAGEFAAGKYDTDDVTDLTRALLTGKVSAAQKGEQ